MKGCENEFQKFTTLSKHQNKSAAPAKVSLDVDDVPTDQKWLPFKMNSNKIIWFIFNVLILQIDAQPDPEMQDLYCGDKNCYEGKNASKRKKNFSFLKLVLLTHCSTGINSWFTKDWCRQKLQKTSREMASGPIPDAWGQGWCREEIHANSICVSQNDLQTWDFQILCYSDFV